MDSILKTIKKLIGINPEYEQFDTDLIIDINAAFMLLHQMGIGPTECYSIVDSDNTWSEFEVSSGLDIIKQYIALRVRLLFNPPTSTSFVTTINEQIKELEVRLYTLYGGY